MHSEGAAKPQRPGAQKKVAPLKQDTHQSSKGASWRSLVRLESFPTAVAEGGDLWSLKDNPPVANSALLREMRNVLPRIQEVLKRDSSDTVTIQRTDIGILVAWESGLALDLVRWVTIAAFLEQYHQEVMEDLRKIANIQDPALRGKAFSEHMKDFIK